MINTSDAINQLIDDVLEKPSFGFVTVINEHGHPVMTRLFGFKTDEDLKYVTAYTFKKDCQDIIPYLKEDTRLAVVISSPLDFKTIQTKGKFQAFYPTPADELTIVDKNNAEQAELMVRWGIPKDVFGAWNYKDSIAIVVSIEEIFDQTPKINAGEKIK